MKAVSDIRRFVTFLGLLSAAKSCFVVGMTRRTYRLPFAIDQALERHAKAQGVTSSVVVRDALSAYLLMEGAAQRTSFDIEHLKQGQQACLTLLERMWEQMREGRKDIVHLKQDRVQARFANLMEETHGRRNDQSD
ncbi:hypothetical protein ACN9MB_13435 [Dyella kyungheensis]|uniref:hypothetical protein n=1 Tax=Dyella kyungheensis TaxID=1242174 RepID=UPI003CEF6626